MRPDLAAQLAFRSHAFSLHLMSSAPHHPLSVSVNSIRTQLYCRLLKDIERRRQGQYSFATLQDGSTRLHFLRPLSTRTMMGAPEGRDALNWPSSCPTAARTQFPAWHASASFERLGSQPSLRLPSRNDTQHELPDACQFLEEVRVRLFATTPFNEGASAATSPQQAVTPPSTADRLKSDRHAAILGSARQCRSLGGERRSPARQRLSSPCAAPQGRRPSLHAPASGTAPALQVLGKAVGKENLPAAQASTSTAAQQPRSERVLHASSQEPLLDGPAQNTGTSAQKAAASLHTSLGSRPHASLQCSPRAIPASTASTPATEVVSNSSTPSPGAFPGFSPMQIDTQPPAAAPLPAMPGFLRKRAQAGVGTGTPVQRPASDNVKQGERQSPTGSMSVSSSSITALQHLAGRAAQEAAAAKGANEQTANRVCSSPQEVFSHSAEAQVIIQCQIPYLTPPARACTPVQLQQCLCAAPGEGGAPGSHGHSGQSGGAGPVKDAATGQRPALVAAAGVPPAAGRGAHRAAELQGRRQRSHGSGMAWIWHTGLWAKCAIPRDPA